MKVLLIGNGQLGRSLGRSLGLEAVTRVVVPWQAPDRAAEVLRESVTTFLATNRGEQRFIAWCAGVGTVNSVEESLSTEAMLFDVCLSASRTDIGEPIGWFLASSAGGLYAGNRQICDENSVPLPTSPYGRIKLEMELRLGQLVESSNSFALIGRISNLYGPDQNLSKPQGFIGHLLNSIACRSSFRYSVPPSTIRDFVFTDDVAARVGLWMSSCAHDEKYQIKNFGSFHSTTLAYVSNVSARVTRIKPQVLFVGNFDGAQPAGVRLRSCQLPNLDHLIPTTPLDVGVWRTWQSVLWRHSHPGTGKLVN
jgi:UDP-glucose 4-epimerase